MSKKTGAASEQAWPADAVERRLVADLIPYARNARTHSEEQVAQLAASIQEWGWTVPVLVDELGGIIAGHGRIMAARKLGITEVPVMVAKGWTAGQKRAYVLADNKLALNAGWDNDILSVELEELGALDFDLSKLGFNDDELSAILGGTVDISGSGEESRGVMEDYLTFGDERAPITEVEIAWFERLLEHYTREVSPDESGFAKWLCDGGSAGLDDLAP